MSHLPFSREVGMGSFGEGKFQDDQVLGFQPQEVGDLISQTREGKSQFCFSQILQFFSHILIVQPPEFFRGAGEREDD